MLLALEIAVNLTLVSLQTARLVKIQRKPRLECEQINPALRVHYVYTVIEPYMYRLRKRGCELPSSVCYNELCTRLTSLVSMVTVFTTRYFLW